MALLESQIMCVAGRTCELHGLIEHDDEADDARTLRADQAEDVRIRGDDDELRRRGRRHTPRRVHSWKRA